MKRFVKKIHMAGIGGAGMAPLAEVLLSRGHSVTGSDRAVSASTRHLESIGIPVQYGHEPSLVAGADILVYSSAVGADNPERRYAAARGIVSMRRAEVLGDVMRSSFTVCVSGTHGKTTTTSLTGTVLTDAGLSPTVLVGGMLKDTGSHAVVGKGNFIVAEADEYDKSFLAMCPSIAVITNIEADHLDCYRDLDDIKDTFVKFADMVPFDGAVVACIDDAGVRDVLPRLRGSVVTYGVDEGADYRAVNVRFDGGGMSFDVYHKFKQVGSISTKIVGYHNVRNILAALAVACGMGIDFDTAASGVANFRGVKRRFERVGEVNGVTVVDDYAHHPGEIAATLSAARASGAYGKIAAVFQPHLYTRTRDFMDEFAEALCGADMVVVTDIYKAREQPIAGVDAAGIVDRVNKAGKGRAWYARDKFDAVKELSGKLGDGDLLIFMGAGDIWEAARDVVKGGVL